MKGRLPVNNRFKDQVAVVTGGADGLGRAIARRIGEEGGGLAIFDANPVKLEEAIQGLLAEGFTATGHHVDVSDEASVMAGFQAALGRHGHVEIMVNCAGIVGPSAIKAADVDVASFERVVKINSIGSFIMTKHALKAMMPNNYGRILLIASIAGKEGNAGMTAYSTSKAAVIGLVKAAGKEYAESGITINGLAPAVVRTAMVEGMPPEQVSYMTDRIPMKRLGQLEEVAAITAWIVSREASFNTGFVFDLSGGRATY